MSSSGIALVCTECGSSWIAPRRLKNSVCADSASWQRPAEASNQAVVGAVPRRRAGASCLSVSLDEFLHNNADGLGDAGIGPTHHLVKDVSDLGVADSGAPALLHREKQVVMSVERRRRSRCSTWKSPSPISRAASGACHPAAWRLSARVSAGLVVQQRIVIVVPRASKLVSARQPKDCPIQDRQDLRDDDLAGSEAT